MGSSALWQAARQGWSVVGIEQFGAVHDRGSSHGQTRIIRTAYFEHPDYVPLARRAWEDWQAIERETGQRLLEPTGLLQIGRREGQVVQGVLESASRHDIPVDVMNASECAQRFPLFRQRGEDRVGVFEPTAGLLRVESCVASLLKLAKEAGAQLQVDTRVQSWRVGDDGVIEVDTNQGPFRGRRLILAGGAWASGLLQWPELRLTVLRKQQHWFQIDRVGVKYQNGFPCYLIETDDGWFYGFPELDHLGIKVAEHTGGDPVDDPSRIDRQLDPAELKRCESFLDQHLDFGRRRWVHHSVCMYTMTEDEHFVLDRHPRFEQVAIAAGFSGHGFKFAPIVGRQLIRLLEGEPDPDCDFLRAGNRFGASDSPC